jgi:DNA-binding response OmpR family regulator
MSKLNIKLDINDELKEKVSERLNRRDINLDSYVLELIQKDIDSKIYFNKDLSFDYVSRKLYIRNEEIFLKPYEYKVLKLLVDNKNEIVKIEDFQSLWEKEMTRFSLRNYIKQLRDKTYPELIVNSSNVGYKLIVN